MSERTTGKKFIKIRGANVNNLKNLSVDIRESADQESLLWHLIRSMQRGRDVIWNLCHLMQGSFWVRWRNRM